MTRLPIAVAQLLTGSLLLATAVGMGQESPDVIFSTNDVEGRPTTAKFEFNDQPIGEGRKAFAAIVERIRKLPAGSSIVWGPNYARCGACSGAEPPCVPKYLYPDLWSELERTVRDRRLVLSSLYPGPYLRPVHDEKSENPDGLAVGWTNYHGPKTPHHEVLYLANGEFLGRGDVGFNNVLARIKQLPKAATVELPMYENSGRIVNESKSEKEIVARNAELRQLVPFAARRAEFDAGIKAQGVKLSFSEAGSPGYEPRTVLDWHSGDRDGRLLVSFGRIVRHDETARPAAARLGWTGYDPVEPSNPNERRALETTATYTLNDAEMGKGVAGFAKAMDALAALPPGSTVDVQVCLRTKGPFLCPITYEGRRHFERTGFEPCFGMFPWLIDIARKSKLDLQWIPDEQKSCGDCQLNK